MDFSGSGCILFALSAFFTRFAKFAIHDTLQRVCNALQMWTAKDCGLATSSQDCSKPCLAPQSLHLCTNKAILEGISEGPKSYTSLSKTILEMHVLSTKLLNKQLLICHSKNC